MYEKISGKAIGGKARAESLSPERRKQISQNALASKNDPSILRATHGSEDHPLIIGEIIIPCYVLEDGRRVLVQRGTASAIGMSNPSGSQLLSFANGKWLEPYLPQKVLDALKNPIKFRSPHGGVMAHGHDATILADICDSVLAARKAGKLLKSQEHIADQCEVLVRGFSRVGIIALIDEATGYQSDRARDFLSKILEAFIARELQPWVKTFPSDYYKELFRLRNLPFPSTTINNPQYFGTLTNNIIYSRLAPGVLQELKKMTPKNDKGKLKVRLFQSLSPNTGYLKLREHIGSVITLMKLSNDYEDFLDKLDKIHPKFQEYIQFHLNSMNIIEPNEGI